MASINLKNLKVEIEKEIKKAGSLKDLDEIFRKYLGKKGKITLIFNSLKKLPVNERKKLGQEANLAKIELERVIKEKAQILKEKIRAESLGKEKIDITRPGKKIKIGHLHPLTLVQREVEEIFQSMGFSVVTGPEVETEWYNFDALNIPKDHPARDMWDTFWLKKDKLLLRTHTSPVQVRFMEKNQPPLRIIVPGSVFRHEATDARHEFQVFQVEGLMVDKKISVTNLKAILAEFFKKFFGKNTAFRLDPDFFPFTEPSFNISVTCVICGGRGCSLCKKTGWLEMAGAGMVHPNVFKNSGLDPREWQGWAFGFGLERLAMMKYKIDDIRLFRSGDLRFLEQF